MNRQDKVNHFQQAADFPEKGPVEEGKMPAWNIPPPGIAEPLGLIVEEAYLVRALDILRFREQQIETQNQEVDRLSRKAAELSERMTRLDQTAELLEDGTPVKRSPAKWLAVVIILVVAGWLVTAYSWMQAETALERVQTALEQVQTALRQAQSIQGDSSEPESDSESEKETPAKTAASSPSASTTTRRVIKVKTPGAATSGVKRQTVRRTVQVKTPGAATSGVKRQTVRRTVTPKTPGK